MEGERANARAKSASRLGSSNVRYTTLSRHNSVPMTHHSRGHPRQATASEAIHYTPLNAFEESVGLPASGGFDIDEDELALDEELKMEFERSVLTSHRRPQRVKYVKFRTRIHPDILVPYLYRGDRHSRINAIIERTGCTIDYCPQSPDEEAADAGSMASPDRFIMSFLVGAETSAQLETANRLLRVLVDRVQGYVETKRAAIMRQRVLRVSSVDGSPATASSNLHGEPDSDQHSSDELKTEAGDVNSTEGQVASRSAMASMRPRLEERWLEETSSGAVESQYGGVQHHRRGSVPGRYRRPVYRRILIDEDGYEVYPAHTFDGRRTDYRAAVSMSPPARGKFRHAEDMQAFQTGDDDRHSTQGTFRPTYQRPRKYSDEIELYDDIRVMHGDQQVRRGLKRRLDPQSASEYSRQRIQIRRGPALHHFAASDEDEDMYFSGDAASDDYEFALDESHQLRQSDRSRYYQPAVSDNHHRVDSELLTPAVQPSSQEDQAVSVHMDHDVNDSCDVAPVMGVFCARDDKADVQTAAQVDANVSIAFGEHDDDSMGEAPSDVESEIAEARTAVLPSDLGSLQPSKAVPGEAADEDDDGKVEELMPHAEVVTHELIDTTRTARNNDAEDESAENRVQVTTHQSMEDTAPQPQRLDDAGSIREELKSTMIRYLEADSTQIDQQNKRQDDLIAARKRVAALESQAIQTGNLRRLAQAVRSFEDCVWRHKALPVNMKNAMSSVLEAAIVNASDSSKPPRERVLLLKSAMNEIMSTTPLPTVASESEAAIETLSADEVHEPSFEEEVFMFENTDELFAPTETPPAPDVFAKPTTIAPLSIPDEAPHFVGSLIKNIEQASGFSSAMASAQRRLLQEISKSDPYYYLQSTQVPSTAIRKTSKSSSCSFGCVGASSLKWEKKIVSQISSRMKWFDSVAYSLAKMPGGKEPLSRKKMNSTIRKLHLVALQVHCLIVHLYCLRKRVECREVDSLTIALNNSYHEKRMNGYKSRIRLTVNQPAIGTMTSTPPPPDDLLRDTFEFFPELLLCIDMWGYDYRRAGPVAGVPPVPTEFLQKQAEQAFDFESDSNGLLQGVCEELLDILCVWNDFKWGESLESLTLDQIVTFETKVKGSVRKVLDAHASHLLALWAVRLINRPVILNGFRLTQPNVYYAEQVTHAISDNATWVMSDQTGSVTFSTRDEEEDQADCESVGDDVWRTEFDSTDSMGEEKENEPAKPVHEEPNLTLLRPHQVLASVRAKPGTRKANSTTWSNVFGMRQTCVKLSDAAGDLVSKEGAAAGAIDESVESLLGRLRETRSLMCEAMAMSEQLTIHSATYQSSDESEDEDMEDHGEEQAPAAEDKRERDDKQSTTAVKQPPAKQDSAPPREGGGWQSSELKDLIEIVTSTNQEVADICTQRARSARVRDKLQAQSLELARQSVQLFQTILHATP